MNCNKCGSDKLSIEVFRQFSQDDGQLENWTLECKSCGHKKHSFTWGYSITNDLIEKIFKK